MSATRQFFDSIDAYNNRVHEAERHLQTLRALQEEREILRAQAGEYMRLSQFDAEVATFTLPRFTFPEGYQPPAPTEQLRADQPAIVRHGEQAAE